MRAAVSLLLLPLLTGCSPRHDAGTRLVFWGLGREGEVVAQLLPAFERDHPGVRVEVQQIPWTAAHEKLLTAFVGDSTPDLAQVGNTWIPELATIGALEPLSAWLASSHVVRRDDYFSGIWETNEMASQVWGVPWYVDTRVLFYRRDLLARAGVSGPPRSWEEWHEALRRLKLLAGRDAYAIYLPTDEWAQPIILGMQRGADLIREGRGAFRQRAFAEAFSFYVSLFQEGLAPVVGNSQVGNYYQRFADGWYAMYVTGPWNLGEFRRRLPAALQDAWATAPLPAPRAEDYPGVSLAGGASLALFRRSPHKAEAWALVEYLARPEQQIAFYRLTGDLPAQRAAWSLPPLDGDARARAFWEQLQRVRPLPAVPEWERIAEHLWEIAEEGIRGRMSERAVLERLDRDVDEMLEKRRWMIAQGRGMQ